MPELDTPTRMSAAAQECAPNVYRLPTGISNAYFVAIDADEFVLIDAGPKGYADRILDTAAELFGAARPRAILLTHGHFDHAGGLPKLLQHWPDTPVYAHALELPYLNGGHRYPPGDPTVGGVMANMSRFLDSSKPTRVPAHIRPLPDDLGELDFLPGWEFRPSPGHTPGHVSYWNAQHRILIAGDAIVTMNQYNPVKALSQTPELSAPPPYATYNWHHARQSARALAELDPYFLCAGHGVPINGDTLASDLQAFVKNFPAPTYGRYLATPARFNRHGPVYIPPAPADYTKRAAILTTTTLAALGLYTLLRRSKSNNCPS
ncbi:MAG TPA: MBL fold metallo-hydrolase [Phycisphaerae bacterium]|nr:MBL fold metallo-hydrolase [Phycisphaerae bacterium]